MFKNKGVECGTKALNGALVTKLTGFITYHTVFMCAGARAMMIDHSIREDACGQTTHLWKYSLLNVLFAGGVVSTYAIFPGGGEAARARVMMITIFHFALTVWGVLLGDSKDCMEILDGKHPHIFYFYLYCLWHNAVLLVFYLMHELFLGRQLGGDLTLMPEVMSERVIDYSEHAHFPRDNKQSDDETTVIVRRTPGRDITNQAVRDLGVGREWDLTSHQPAQLDTSPMDFLPMKHNEGSMSSNPYASVDAERLRNKLEGNLVQRSPSPFVGSPHPHIVVDPQYRDTYVATPSRGL